MIFDRMLSFFENATVAASATTNGRAVDMRLNGADIDHNLNVYICAVGAKPSISITTKIQGSDDGSTWTELASQTSVGNELYKGALPLTQKRFIRASVTAGAMSASIKVKGGIVVGEVESEPTVKLQGFPPLEDLASSTVQEIH